MRSVKFFFDGWHCNGFSWLGRFDGWQHCANSELTGICKDALAAQLQLEEYVQRAVNASGQRSMCRFLQLHLAEIALETRPALCAGINSQGKETFGESE